VRYFYNLLPSGFLKGDTAVTYSYVDILATLIVAVGFVLGNYALVWLLAPKNPLQGEKLETYECGELPFDDALVNFNIRYYVFALTFFVFDMEAIFLYPWAVVFNALGLFGLIEMLAFLVVLGIGLLYAYKKGVLHWV
jgi:NADH-quinone oxidoreductase subunit A